MATRKFNRARASQSVKLPPTLPTPEPLAPTEGHPPATRPPSGEKTDERAQDLASELLTSLESAIRHDARKSDPQMRGYLLEIRTTLVALTDILDDFVPTQQTDNASASISVAELSVFGFQIETAAALANVVSKALIGQFIENEDALVLRRAVSDPLNEIADRLKSVKAVRS